MLVWDEKHSHDFFFKGNFLRENKQNFTNIFSNVTHRSFPQNSRGKKNQDTSINLPEYIKDGKNPNSSKESNAELTHTCIRQEFLKSRKP